MRMKSQAKRVWCRYCFKETAAKIPKGGDGSVWHTRWHRDKSGYPCPGNDTEAHDNDPRIQ